MKFTSDIFQNDDQEGDRMMKLFNVELLSGDDIHSNEHVRWTVGESNDKD